MTAKLAVDNNVALVTLSRPEALNAIDPEMRHRLREIYQEISDHDDIRVAIFTGAGDRAFSAGVDLKKSAVVQSNLASEEFGGKSEHLLSGFPSNKPVICAINGFALGGGLEIALRADIRVASSNAEFGLPEVKIGSIPGSGGTQMLPRVVGVPHALKMILTGGRIDAQEALRIGLVDEVVERDELLERASSIARSIAKNAPLAVSAAKKLILESLETPLSAGIALERYAFGLLRDTDDRAEGRRAFAEKRAPLYTGK